MLEIKPLIRYIFQSYNIVFEFNVCTSIVDVKHYIHFIFNPIRKKCVFICTVNST